MVAGEASGDLLASLLLQGARQRWPQLQARGIGGAHMEAEGFVAQWPSEALAVHGYSLEVLRRVAVIKVAQRTGIPLAEIQAALSSLPENRTPTAADWKRLSARWRDALDARINSLIRLRDQLDGCIGCGCLSLKACPLRNPWDELADEGPGARLLEGDT